MHSTPTHFDADRLLDRELDMHSEGGAWSPAADFERALRVLVGSFAQDAGLHAIGRRSLEGRLRRIVAGRAALDCAQIGPANSCARLVVIIGLPRTGTTLLHHALVDLGRFQSVPTWKAMFPAMSEEHARDRTQIELDLLRRSAPGFVDRHPMGVAFPAECASAMEYTGFSRQFEVTAPVWGYSRWLSEQSLANPYSHYLRWLPALTVSRNGSESGAVALKGPAHLLHIEDLVAAAPDADIIWLHRDPAAVFASGCTMVAAAHRGMSRRDTTGEVVERWLDAWPSAVERSMQAVAGHDVTHLRYTNLVAGIRSTLRILSQRHGTRSPSNEEVSVWLNAHQPETFGHRGYSLGALGLEAEDVRRRFSRYLDLFPLAVETVP